MAREVIVDPATTTTVRRSGGGVIGTIVYVLFGLLELLLLFRFVFLLLGANSGNGFVDFIYRATEPFVSPFYGIFSQVSATNNVASSVFDPATIIAIVVYAMVAWAIVRILEAITGRPVA